MYSDRTNKSSTTTTLIDCEDDDSTLENTASILIDANLKPPPKRRHKTTKVHNKGLFCSTTATDVSLEFDEKSQKVVTEGLKNTYRNANPKPKMEKAKSDMNARHRNTKSLAETLCGPKTDASLELDAGPKQTETFH